jgi:hypothetical protein
MISVLRGLMSSDTNTNRPFVSLILLGIFDFCCILIGLEQISNGKVLKGIMWIVVGILSGLIGFYWQHIKQKIGNQLVASGRFVLGESSTPPTENTKEATLAERVFELATRYKKAAREFHKRNPQPPAPPALTTWATKANGWQKVNFHADLRRIYDELAAEGFNSLALDLAIECTPTFGQVEQTTQLLRFLASQLDDDPGDYQNARLPESERFVFVNVTSFKVDEKITYFSLSQSKEIDPWTGSRYTRSGIRKA